MEKKAQFLDFPFITEVLEKPQKEDKENDEKSFDHIDVVDFDVKEVKEEGLDEPKKEITFKLDLVPGADEDTVEVLEDEPVEMDEKTNTPVDDWDWEGYGGTGKFLEWLQERFQTIPRHTGQDTTGVERALAYFERLKAEVRRAMRKDFKREIDARKAEEALEEIHKGVERLEERLEKLETRKFKRNKKKNSAFQAQLVKNADTVTTGKIMVAVPYLISNVARSCIEATVQGGKDIEDVFKKTAEELKLDKREKYQVACLIKDMGYPMMLDRVNPFKDVKPGTTEVSEYMTQYYA